MHNITGLATSVTIAVLLLLTAPTKLKASDQSSGTNARFVQVTVAPTGTVTVCGPKLKLSIFISADDIPHTVVSTEGVFKSKVRDTDEKFSYKFTKAGTYPYYCSVHPKITGLVVVK
jgi:hypothetical protein